MLDKMAKKEKTKKQEQPVAAEPKRRYFPTGRMLAGVALILLGGISLLNYYLIPRTVVDVLLILSGLWLFKLALSSGFSKKRREIFKKYI